MRRFWTYVGAVLPLTAATDSAGAALNPFSDVGEGSRSRRGDPAGGDEDAAGGSDGKPTKQGDSDGSPAGDAVPQGHSSVSEGDSDAVTQEIRGLLNELDQMSGSAEVNFPNPSEMYGSASSGMYAPANATSGQSSGNGTSVSALVDSDDEDDTEADVPEVPEVDGDDDGADTENDTSTDLDDTSGEPDVEDVDSMLVMLGGTAGGTDGTTTDGDIDLEILDYGQVTVAYGKATFTATSDWDGTGEPPESYAETFLDVYDADLVFFYHVDGYASSDGTQYTESSTLYVVAVDFEDDHPLANEFDLSDNNAYQFEGDPGLMLAGYDGTPEGGYFSNSLLDGIPFSAFSQYYSDANGDVHLDGSGADLNFLSSALDGSDDPFVLVGDVNTVEDVASSSDLIAQTEYGELSISVAGYGPDTYTSIDAQMLGVDDDFSGIAGLAIGIA
jgi:hypothetical protein